MQRGRFAIVVACLTLGATLSPVLRDPSEPSSDGFPLSTYPMFASKRERVLKLGYALGATATNERRLLKPRLVGSFETMQAVEIVRGALARGEERALCARIAANVAVLGDPDIVQVRIVIGTHDAVELVARGTLGQEVDRARCPVKR